MLQVIRYIYHDPDNTFPHWIGYEETFDDTVISIADKIAEQYDLRTSGLSANGNFKSEHYWFNDSLSVVSATGGIDANGIFDNANNGSVTPSNFVAEIKDDFHFLTPLASDKISIGDTAFTPNGVLHVKANNGNGIYLDGVNSGASTYSLKLRDGNGLELNRFRNSGRVDLAVNGNVTYMGDQATNYASQSVQIFKQFSNTATYNGFVADRNGNKLGLRSTSGTRSHITSTGGMFFGVGWNGNEASGGGDADVVIGIGKGVGIGLGYGGANENPVERLKIRGKASGTAKTMMLESLSLLENFSVVDNGQINIPRIPQYSSVALAQADAGLSIGSMWHLSLGGDSVMGVVRVKV